MVPRVVYDSMLFLQGAANESGPAFACFRLAENGTVKLLLSPSTLAEATDVLSRPLVREKLKTLTDERVTKLLSKVRSFSESLPDPPKAFTLPRDAKDEIYTNLAIAGGAQFLVSWNERHLNYLMNADTPEGRDFSARFPNLKIVTPPVFLAKLRSETTAAEKGK